MPFIGNQPAKVPLTSADITDGIIVNADISSTAGITLNKLSGNPNFRNRIINGNMAIDQRNAGASVTPANGVFTYTLDRWSGYASQSSKYTVQQNAGSVTRPVGFTNYLGVTSSSAYSIISSDLFMITQPIEGLNVADLGFGTANAKTVTVSFWVRSSLTGTFGGSLLNSAGNRSYPFTYTINSTNTFEFKTITINGDTSGTWLTTNGIGIYLSFGIGVGSTYSGTAGAWSGSQFWSATGATSVVGTNGATFYITGVQLEAGTSATDFEFMPIDVNLNRCYRYFELETTASGSIITVSQAYSTSASLGYKQYKVIKRAAPSISYTGTAISLKADTTSGGGTLAFEQISVDNCRANITSASGLVAGNASAIYANGTEIKISYSAEL